MNTLPRIVIVCVFALWLVDSIFAQQPSPAPLPYSDSIPYKPRVFVSKPEKKKKVKSEIAAVTVAQPLPPELMPGNGPTVQEDLPITIPISVFDAQGNFVIDLKKEDFKVLVDGPEAAVLSVEQRSDPSNVYLVIDTSPSSGAMLDTVKKLASSITAQFSSDDRISLFKFAGRLKRLTSPNDERETLNKAIKKLTFDDGTSLYDITQEFGSELMKVSDVRTIVVILTDGVDTTSRSAYTEALVSAERSGAVFFPVYLDTFPLINDPRRLNGLPPSILQTLQSSGFRMPNSPGSLPEEYMTGRYYLNDLVMLSGGRAVDGQSILNGTAKVSMSIASELRRQYYLTFSPVGSAYVGQRKHIKVRVSRPNLAVIARGSYVVGSPPSKITTQ